MIPIRDHNPTRTTSYLTISLIVANVLIFLTEPISATNVTQARFFFCKAAIPFEVLPRGYFILVNVRPCLIQRQRKSAELLGNSCRGLATR